jgi:hypothetical protein
VFNVGGQMSSLVAHSKKPGFVNLKRDPTLVMELRALDPSIRLITTQTSVMGSLSAASPDI